MVIVEKDDFKRYKEHRKPTVAHNTIMIRPEVNIYDTINHFAYCIDSSIRNCFKNYTCDQQR